MGKRGDFFGAEKLDVSSVILDRLTDLTTIAPEQMVSEI